jgi:predicted dehydrogenase/threonine dehydrogenase-like Zn-dependent dehydrogenase
MKQVVQSISGGPIRVDEVPVPSIGPTEVLVRTLYSVISPGTERAVTQLAQSGLVAKARARPDLVRQVVKKARTEGVAQTVKAVRGRMSEDLPLGYSAVGVVLEVGDAVAGIVPGQAVATAGAGRANHAEYQSVPGLLCTPLPDGVDPEDAAITTIASIALHGLRLADVGLGSKIVVIGLGLVGQLTVRLAQAAGCDVAGIDIGAYPVETAAAAGATAMVEKGNDTTQALLDWSRGRGADAVLITAGGKSSDAIMRTPPLCRDRATVVVVGDVGLDLARTPFYEKELSLRFARSYGPGRYERTYEDWGVDYPAGFVRWTEGRNMEAILDLIAAGRLHVRDLITHRYPIQNAESAYSLIKERSEPFLGVQLVYEDTPVPEKGEVAAERPAPAAGSLGVGLLGAGQFASSVLVPAFKEAGFDEFVTVSSGSGLSASRLAASAGFQRAVSGADAVINDPAVGVVVVATPHDLHAALTVQALKAGRHVFCEKPLALTLEELDEVDAAAQSAGSILFVGFNRRWSRPVELLREHFARGTGPLVVTYRVNAGALPESHWYHDRRQGGRLIGEVCHFIDTCAAIVGEPATEVHATGSGAGERALDENVAVTLRYPDGSVATITYAAGGHPSTEKERIDVLGRGRSGAIADFRKLELDGKATTFRPQDKGHVAEVKEFRRQIRTGRTTTADAIASMRTTLVAAAALGGGGAAPSSSPQ